jgi:hypothetical protein
MDRIEQVPKVPVLCPFPFQIRYEACNDGLHNISFLQFSAYALIGGIKVLQRQRCRVYPDCLEQRLSSYPSYLCQWAGENERVVILV